MVIGAMTLPTLHATIPDRFGNPTCPLCGCVARGMWCPRCYATVATLAQVVARVESEESEEEEENETEEDLD